MSQKGRIITLVVRFEQDTYPQWILDAHMKGPQHGVTVTTLAEGDKVQELNDEMDASIKRPSHNDGAERCDTCGHVNCEHEKCEHADTERGPDIPLVYGSHQSEVCKTCKQWRQRGHVPKSYVGGWRNDDIKEAAKESEEV